MGGVILTDPSAQLSHSSHRRPEIIFHPRRDVHTEFRAMPNLCPRVGRTNEALGRNAPHIQAIPSHEMTFDKRNLCAHAGRNHSGDQPCGACADHDDVVASVGRRIDPIGWVHVSNQLPVVLVIRQNQTFDIGIHRIQCSPLVSRHGRRLFHLWASIFVRNRRSVQACLPANFL